MSNPNKDRGDRFERDVRDHLAANGFPDCARTRAGYARDAGDLHLDRTARVIAQAKNRREWRIGEWLTQLDAQADEAGARHAFLVVKRPKVSDPGAAFCVMDLDALIALLREAGYPDVRSAAERADTTPPAPGMVHHATQEPPALPHLACTEARDSHLGTRTTRDVPQHHKKEPRHA